ncbi:hypothetical protein ALC60_07646 [Trachymyrmex zeteki]|uniref:Uncharacterized protein n=1 Tax=Mycetomoellerius zeteki TaxID=64791 RepID=A0A151WZA6_9HYME|nr:hypothetical protein ALC60_07646 [Trachymyrmex zeteki]
MQQSTATCVFIPVRTPAPTTVRAGMLYRGRGQRVEKNRWYPWPKNLGRPDAYAIRILCLPSFFVGRLVVLVGTTGGGWGDSVLPVTDRLPPLLLLSSPSLSYPPPTLPSEHIFDLYVLEIGHITILQIIFNLSRHLWHHTQAGVLNIYEVVEITVSRTSVTSYLATLQLCFFIRHRKDFNCRILRYFRYLDRKGVFTI